jgi:hypothetical protein
MGTPKENIEKITQVINAWETLRPDKSFAGMTLADYKLKTKPSYDTRDKLVALDNQTLAGQDQRDTADLVSIDATQHVVNSVRGDPTEGDDGELYEAMGYVRKSDRSSGLHRGQPAAGTPAAKA